MLALVLSTPLTYTTIDVIIRCNSITWDVLRVCCQLLEARGCTKFFCTYTQNLSACRYCGISIKKHKNFKVCQNTIIILLLVRFA